MKIKYSKPTTKVILITGGQHLLTESNRSGVQATISGYEADDGEGFTQYP